MKRIFIAIAAALCLLNISNAYHILVVFPFPGRSHGILGEGQVKRLLEAGHEVTYISAFPIKNKNPRFHEIDISETLQVLPADKVNIQAIMDNKVSTSDPRNLLKMMLQINNITFYNPEIQSLLRDKTRKFDAVIMEWMFSEIPAGFAAALEVPLIMFSSTDPHTLALSLIDEHTNPSYVPNILSGNIPPFSFIQRVIELGLHTFLTGVKQFIMKPQEAEFYDNTFGKLMREQGKTPPEFGDLIYSSALMLGNSHVSLGGSLRLPQNYKPVGGYHIDTVVKPLPEDLQKFMDSAKNGVIYFSMGSNLKSKDLPDSTKQSLLKMFGKLKYTVLWKFEEVLSDLPSNVRIIQWAPQPSILAHPNCILFITHGGLLSTTETVHFGKPIIGIPVFADQFINVQKSVMKGFALKVTLAYTMADDLKVAIDEILSNSSYAARAKALSLIYHDRPVKPGKELVHWVEHVIKTGGAPHLRSPALFVPWYQKIYLDLLAIVLLALYVLKRIIKMLCCRTKPKVDKKKKNK